MVMPPLGKKYRELVTAPLDVRYYLIVLTGYLA